MAKKKKPSKPVKKKKVAPSSAKAMAGRPKKIKKAVVKKKKQVKKAKPAKKKKIVHVKKITKIAPKVAVKAPVKVAPKKILAPLQKKVMTKMDGKKQQQQDILKAPAKKIVMPPKRAYQMQVEKEVLPQVIPHIVPGAGRIPSVSHSFPAYLKVHKVEDGRCYFVDDEGNPHVPSLIEMQLLSYKWFLTEGLKELLEEISPITDFSGKKLELRILGHTFDPPKYDPDTCRRRNLSYEAAMKGHVQLINRETGEIKEQDVFLGSIPLMTDSGTFIVDGIERVVVHQLVRSPGVFFSKMPDHPKYHAAKIIPKRGVWLEVETDRRGIITCKIDRKRKIPITQLLRVFGYDTDTKIIDLFSDVSKKEQDYIQVTLDKDSVRTVEEAYQSVYRKIRPGDLATPENAKQLIDSLFFDFKKYDMGTIARYKLNRRFNVHTPSDEQHRVFQVKDFIEILKELVRLNNGEGVADDIDHLSNRRVRSVGELVQNKYRVGLVRTERIIKDRMTVMDMETVTPTQLINCRPITAAMREFFASSQLSQFMDQTNPLAELAHKRRLSAMGPGGLSRERASFDVRDVHTSHYGRICPIATPEGPNIGLVVHLAGFARVNEYGFLETPYREVRHEVTLDPDKLMGRILDATVKESRKVIAKEAEVIDSKETAKKVIAALKKEGKNAVPVRAYITNKVSYVDAEQERHVVIAQAQTQLSDHQEFLTTRIPSRKAGETILAHVRDVTHVDVSPRQILSISTSLIPFLEHDDNTRASMGTNMQRQAVPLVRPHSPFVGTGIEGLAARASGHALLAEEDGEVTMADAQEISIVYRSGRKQNYRLNTFTRTNQGTCFNMRPCVVRGDTVKKGESLADGSSVEKGELALGQNLLVAYMSWEGYNFEDAVIISDRVVQNGFYDSIHIESYITDIRDTKLGPELVTRDIPNVGEAKLKDLGADGIVRIGATVHEGDILVGKITPKGETELTPEERLLQAIFGDKAKDVKDSSLRLPGGAGGKVVDVHIFDRAEGDELPTGVIKQIKVFVAQTRKIQVGDKMAGRHGNKGVVARIVPRADMPYLADGTHVDIILNPLGVTSRMNIGQILETHLGWACQVLGIKVATPALNGISTEQIEGLLKAAGLPPTGKIQLFDGRTGEKFAHETTVGYVYMLKLLHLVEDKIHARSVGPYSLVTQQPLGGKAQHGGQRFGEMEVWALEAYGAAYTLQEMLTIKSDDVIGRSKAYESIVKGEAIRRPSIPESFNVLVKELQALGLKVELLKFKEEVAPEERLKIDAGEIEKVELASRVTAEDEAQAEVAAIAELEEPSVETGEEVAAAIEEGAEVDASGESAKDEMKDASSEEAMQDA
ncbi:DNA-directed RNA polymerase subunit beta [Candidatus Peribacteria bacterium RIFCSPHIGHO2_02_FULL_52_16]|nr:MAG: DNA-directed RNA polymerase subunit beta [Candidatus Peribacteria bacterium RIFCSPHIGHO2_01_FULL_51_35]OGJ60599.1 MAG: DNA-directed RNA polymerase subunit beta [Candidatus Peribacteria bacterium RIFCSPHIGHO2_02_FULL_52_16]